MINVTSMLKLENEELKEALNLSMKNIDCIYTEENLIQSPYNYKNLELSGLSGATFDFLARIRIIKKIGRTDISEVISIPHAVVRELKENGLKNLKKAKLSNPRLYINIISFVMLFIGVALIASGVLSFIYSHDLIFSIIFTALIALYLLIDFILQKKLKN